MKNILIITSFFLFTSYSVNAQLFEVDSLILDCSEVPDNYLRIISKGKGHYHFNKVTVSSKTSGIGFLNINYSGCFNHQSEFIFKDTSLFFDDSESNIKTYYVATFEYDSTTSNCNDPVSISEIENDVSCTYWNSIKTNNFDRRRWYKKDERILFTGSEHISQIELYNNQGQQLYPSYLKQNNKSFDLPQEKGFVVIRYKANNIWFIEKVIISSFY